MSKRDMNKTERSILEQLYADATISWESLADELSEDIDDVKERISELKERNFVGQQVAVVDPVYMGYDITTYHFMSTIVNYNDALREQIKQVPEWDGTQLAVVVLGDFDLIFRKLSTDEASLDRFTTNVLSDPEIASAERQELETYRLTQRIRWRGIELPQPSQRDPQPYDITYKQEQVLRLLQADGSLRNDIETLASKADVASDEARAIVNELEENNIIVGYSHPVNFQEMGWYRAFFGLSTEQGGYHNTISAIQDEESLNVPYISSGLGFSWADIFVELVFETIEELDEITNRLWGLDSVRSTRTYFGTETFYQDESISPPSIENNE